VLVESQGLCSMLLLNLSTLSFCNMEWTIWRSHSSVSLNISHSNALSRSIAFNIPVTINSQDSPSNQEEFSEGKGNIGNMFCNKRSRVVVSCWFHQHSHSCYYILASCCTVLFSGFCRLYCRLRAALYYSFILLQLYPTDLKMAM
jgi:hypothetical protein